MGHPDLPFSDFCECGDMPDNDMRQTFKCFILTVFVTALLMVAIGCKHTAQGAGKDIEKMGEKIQEKTR